jgi:hypothetical protein
LLSVDKSSRVLRSYRDLRTVKGFVCTPLPSNLIVEDSSTTNLIVVPDPKSLPSYRNLLLVSMEKFLELLEKDSVELNIPYSLPFVEGLRYMLSNID